MDTFELADVDFAQRELLQIIDLLPADVAAKVCFKGDRIFMLLNICRQWVEYAKIEKQRLDTCKQESRSASEIAVAPNQGRGADFGTYADQHASTTANRGTY